MDRSAQTKSPTPQQHAQGAVANALKKGALKRLPCEVCGVEKTHAHHDDYSKPLEVRWLCASHHTLVHNALNRSRREPAPVRVVSWRYLRENVKTIDRSVVVYLEEGSGSRRKLGLWIPALPDNEEQAS